MSLRNALLIVALLATQEAHAHAFLAKSTPAVGSVTAHATNLTLEFTEAIELSFSGADVSNSEGKAIAIAQFRFADDDHKVLVAALPALMPGAYHVKWHVVSADTHRTEGDFTFTVKP